MKTAVKDFDGVNFVVPVQLEFPNKIKNCCGPSGLLGKIIPEAVWGLRVSSICYIHDFCFDISEPTWEDFHVSNTLFMTNALILIQAHPSKFGILNAMRVYRVATYYNAIDLIGPKFFWGLKEEQGYLCTDK